MRIGGGRRGDGVGVSSAEVEQGVGTAGSKARSGGEGMRVMMRVNDESAFVSRAVVGRS